MAHLSTIRSRRRSAGERHALVRIERDIRSADSKLRRKYLRDFADAFRTYERVISPDKLAAKVHAADVILVGDYHALPASQRYATQLLRELATANEFPVLALEAVFTRDQHILDAWMRSEIGEDELRQRIRFDTEWGFDWAPLAEMLLAARTCAVGCYGIDCMPRHDLRTISLRDGHAALKLAEIRERHPKAPLLVLFGESHLAPGHLPRLLKQARPTDRVVTVLQNVDSLYWRAAGEQHQDVKGVEVSDDVMCVFSATPLEKYQSYSHWIERWRQARASSLDLSPTFYNLIDALARFLNIDQYSSDNGLQPRFLIDNLPEIRVRADTDDLRKLFLRVGITGMELANLIASIERTQSCYVERLNTIFATGFELAHAAGQCARFLHLACSGRLGNALPDDSNSEEGVTPESLFYAAVMDEALKDLGARALHPARPATREADLFALYSTAPDEVEQRTLYSYREFMQMLDFLVMHRDYETNPKRYFHPPQPISEPRFFEGSKFSFVTRKLGALLGTDLFTAYLEGRVSKRYLRSLYFRKLQLPEVAQATYSESVRRARRV